jgi:tetratricopeptide (TPR) repeat protein
MTLKSSLTQLFDQVAQAEQDYIESLTLVERQATGQSDAWAPKDNLLHIGAWQGRLAQNLDAGLNGGELRHYDNWRELNDQYFEQEKLLPWDDCLEQLTADRAALRSLFDSLSEADLLRLDVLPWQEGRPVWRLIEGNMVDHVVSHLCMLYNARGERGKALRLMEQTSEAIAGLDPDPLWQGNVIYNLGCVYALSGEKSKAIQKVKEAFALRPDLPEWARQDSDLDSLRDEPEFKALFE